jgi:hemerythrin
MNMHVAANTLISWDETFKVGVAEIDEQHKNLVRLINDLHSGMTQGQGKSVIGKILNDLFAYTATHFNTEEFYFGKLGYPDSAPHKQEHAAFVAKVVAFKQDFDAGKIGLSISVMTFLRDWLKGHIKGSDKKYGPFFNSKGIV